MGRWLWERRIWGVVGSVIVLAVALRWYIDVPLVDGRTNYEALVTLLLSAGTFIGLIASLIPWLRETLSVGGKQKRADELQRRNRGELIRAVDEIWISGYLDKVLHQMESFPIELRYLEPEKVAQRMGGQPYALKDNRAALQTFRDFGGKLVILGEPGAGKTVLLLQLAEGLLGAAQQDATKPVPVIFPLSAWAEKQLPFGEWLQGELQDRYGAPKGQAAAWVGGEQLIFLLDGLDEVTAEQRGACLRAIQAFVEDRDRSVQYILCSRRAEYVELVEGGTQLNVPGEIVLKALGDEAIRRFLAGEEFRALRALLDENAMLREEFARIPFLLNTMAYVTRGDTPEKARLALGGRTDAASLRDYFLEEYVSKRLREQPNPRYPDAAETRRWLRWLAGQLIRERQTDFYLENMQPTWLDTAAQVRGWRWGGGVGVGLLIVLANSITGWLPFGPLIGIVLGLISAILYVIRDEINTADQLRWSRKHGKSTVILGLLILLGMGLAIAIAGTLAIGVAGMSAIAAAIGIIRLISIFVISTFVTVSFWGLIGGLRSHETSRFRISPGQGIHRSLRNAFSIGLPITSVCFLMGYIGTVIIDTNSFQEVVSYFWGPVVGSAMEQVTQVKIGTPLEIGYQITVYLALSVTIGLTYMTYFGLGAFIQHYVLRYVLWRSGHLPYWRYDRFLDYAAEVVILRKVGGGYRFAHDVLRGHLAGADRDQGLGIRG